MTRRASGGAARFASINQIDDGIGLVHGNLRLPGDLNIHAEMLLGESTGINDHIGLLPKSTSAITAIAGQTGVVGDDGVARLRQHIEQCGLADIGPANQCNYR